VHRDQALRLLLEDEAGELVVMLALALVVFVLGNGTVGLIEKDAVVP
jgi:hypothetical protein